MTKLVQHDVEEFQQMRGQRRKLTKALFVISMLKPMSDDSRNFPLIVLSQTALWGSSGMSMLVRDHAAHFSLFSPVTALIANIKVHSRFWYQLNTIQ